MVATQSIPRTGDRMYIKCPVCTTVMNRKLFSMGSGVIIDVCRSHGVFFDAGELPRVIDFVMQGGLEKASKKESGRAREEARTAVGTAQIAGTIGGGPRPGNAEAMAFADLLTSLLW